MTASPASLLVGLASIWLVCGTTGAQCQNLVFNPSFELIDSCPPSPNNLGYQDGAAPAGWWRWSNTPDYFNACATDTFAGVPKNLFGYQPAYDGNAYSGFYAYHISADSFREMIGTQLITPLVPGVTYYASMRVSPAYGGYYQFSVFSDHMGMLFTQDPYVGGWMNPSYPLRNYSQVWQPSIVTDTTNWTLVSGSFVADSAYQYLIIGNHFDNANTDTLWGGPGYTGYTYYYVDDVCVSVDAAGCPLGTSIVSPSMSSIRLAPNPATTWINISGVSQQVNKVTVLDGSGRIVIFGACCTEGGFDVSLLAPGSYGLVLSDDVGNYVTHARFMKR